MQRCSRRSRAGLADVVVMKQMMKLEIETVIVAILADKLVVDVEAVTSSARLVEDLGADSLNFLDIALEINYVLGIELLPEGLASIRNVEDLYRVVHQAIAQASV